MAAFKKPEIVADPVRVTQSSRHSQTCRAASDELRIKPDPRFDLDMEPNDTHENAAASPEPSYADLVAEIKTWREASARWKKVEAGLTTLRDRYEALSIAARTTSHG